jgi:DNA-directed RNA polymerase subunit RPC12/RpoP
MRSCSHCGGRLKRIHRSFLQRFRYMAIYKCRQCDHEEFVSRQYMYHAGTECRCPKCGTYRVSKLKERDKIDPLHTGLLNLLERMAGGTLHYCCFCRLQFYDRRVLAPRNSARRKTEPEPVTNPPGTANSGE